MANEGNAIVTYTRKIVVFACRVGFRFGSNHPFILGTVGFLFLVYRLFPCLFAFFVSSSPVLICTTVLLGIILSNGEVDVPDTGDDKKNIHSITNKDENATKDRDAPGKGNVPKNEFSREILSEGVKNAGGDAAGDQNKRFVVNSRDVCSDTESDQSSSSDASITDVTPVIEEHHRLLDADAAHPAFKTADNSDLEENESDDGSTYEEDNQDDEEEDEDAQEEKDEGVQAKLLAKRSNSSTGSCMTQLPIGNKQEIS